MFWGGQIFDQGNEEIKVHNNVRNWGETAKLQQNWTVLTVFLDLSLIDKGNGWELTDLSNCGLGRRL